MSAKAMAPGLPRAELSGAARAGATALLFVGAADLLFLNGWVFPRALDLGSMNAMTSSAGRSHRPAVSVARMTTGETAPAPAVRPAQPGIEPIGTLSSRAATSVASGPPLGPAAAEARLRPLRQLYFPRNVHALDPRGREALQALAARATRAGATIVVGGHADQTGPEVFNGWLSEQRAVTVADQLAALGVPRERIVIRHYGSARPAAPGDNPRAMRRNRRVEIALAEGGTP
jgi:outer membrane protein OmpA-like peptidoglycan-associated protein